MNELVVPPAPHWYRSTVVTCSPDNVLVYGSKNDIVVIKEKSAGEPVDVHVIHGAHFKHVTSVSLNKQWKDPHSYVASLGEDNLIKVWDLDTFEKKATNKDHTEHQEPVVGAIFAGDDRVVSATVGGLVVVWNINTNESKPLRDLFKGKVTVTCLSSCPFAGWLLAFGLSNGGVVVADLRRNGQVLYKLRGHYQAVVSLSWCPAPINVFPRGVNNKVKNKSSDEEGDQSVVVKDVIPKPEKTNPWINLVHADDGEVSASGDQLLMEGVQNFLKECDKLKSRILGLDVSTSENEPDKEAEISEEDIRKNIEDSIVKEERREEIQNRPLPQCFDPSDDIFQDLGQEEKTDDDQIATTSKAVEGEVSEESNALERKVDEKSKAVEGEVVEDSKAAEGKVGDDSKALEGKEGEESKALGEEGEERKAEQEEKAEELSTPSDETNEPEVAKPEVLEEEPRTEYLLASAGKDRNVYIWRAGTDGRMQTFFQTGKSNRRDKTTSNWMAMCWVAPDTILTSSATGEILAWPVPKPRDSSRQFKIVHNDHSALVFNIVTPPKYSTAYNWSDSKHLTIWSWSQDGKLLNYDFQTQKMKFAYPTVTSLVNCFGSCPLDPNRLAIGLRDGGIRIWDLSLPHKNVVHMQKFQQKFTHKISAIDWHPTKETILGFGTEEGRVGFIDLTTKKTSLFPHYFRTQVYKVEWGPIGGDSNNLGLYVVSEGKMALYDAQRPLDDPIQLPIPEKLFVYKFAWKPNYSILLLNGKDGSVVILKPDLSTLTTFYPSEKGLNAIVWHPDAFTDQRDISPRCHWFAATTTKGLFVFDCDVTEDTANLPDKMVVTLEGHVKPPLALAWCPFEGNKIVSTAGDGLAHVWDVTTKAVVSTFVDPHFCQNPAVSWSPSDPDLIIMGDKVVRVWSIAKNPPKSDEEFLAARKRLLGKSPKSESEKVDKTAKVDASAKPRSSPKNCIVPSFYVSNDDNIDVQVANMRKLMVHDEEVEEDKALDALQLFGSKEQVQNLLEANYLQQKKEGKHKSCEMISLWKGNVAEYIRNAINENRVTPSIITLAPMVSSKLWQEACLTYAKKLSEEASSDPLETATYFLACHKVEEAINCLCVNSMYKEALALAKQRLPENSQFITKVVEKWAEHCANAGNFENAAYCYISIRDYENAAKVLSRRAHKQFLEFAVELAEKARNKGLSASIRFKIDEGQGSSETEKDFPSRVEALFNRVIKNGTRPELEESHPKGVIEDLAAEGFVLAPTDEFL